MARDEGRKIEFLDVDFIEAHGARRTINPDAVEALSASMQSIGLRTPISVRYYHERPDHIPAGETDDALVLMTGAHRLAAAKKLGWEKIECFVHYDGDEIDAELWEIAENLHRAELTALERDEQVARWIELSAARIDTDRVNSKPGPKGKVRDAAKEIGVNREDARRAVKVAKLSDEAKAVAKEVGLDDNRTALLEAAAKPTVGEQVAALREREIRRGMQEKIIAARAQKSVSPAPPPLNDIETLEQWLSQIMRLWNRAPREWREAFMERVDTPVMDAGSDDLEIPGFLQRTA